MNDILALLPLPHLCKRRNRDSLTDSNLLLSMCACISACICVQGLCDHVCVCVKGEAAAMSLQ